MGFRAWAATRACISHYTSHYTGTIRGISRKLGYLLWNILAAPQGFEPRYADPESGALRFSLFPALAAAEL